MARIKRPGDEVSSNVPPICRMRSRVMAMLRPEALRGELWLLAAQAQIYGRTLVFEPK